MESVAGVQKKVSIHPFHKGVLKVEIEIILQNLFMITFFAFVTVIQIIDFKGKNIAKNLSMEIMHIVIKFPIILALLTHRCKEQATLLNVSALWYSMMSIVVILLMPETKTIH